MAIGNDFYPDQGFTDLANLYRTQSNQSIGYGDQAARYADPFMGERGKYQKQLSDLLANPGGFASSPVYKFAYDQGLEALNRKGSLRSGNKLAALEKYGQDMASQQYFPQAQLLSNLAMSGSSPASAGLSYARGVSDSQAQRQMSETLRAAGSSPTYQPAGTSSLPWYMSSSLWGSPSGGSTLPTGGASGGYDMGYGGGYGNTYGGAGYGYGSGGYVPTSGAGSGYMTSDYGTTNFGSLYQPYERGGITGGDTPNIIGNNYSNFGYTGGADPFGFDSGGYSDYGDYSGYGWDE